jgi:hypothetical protein
MSHEAAGEVLVLLLVGTFFSRVRNASIAIFVPKKTVGMTLHHIVRCVTTFIRVGYDSCRGAWELQAERNGSQEQDTTLNGR